MAMQVLGGVRGVRRALYILRNRLLLNKRSTMSREKFDELKHKLYICAINHSYKT